MTITEKITRWVDSIVRVDGLSESYIRQVRANQLRSLMDTVPILSIGAFLSTCIFAHIMWNTDYRAETLAICAAIATLQLFSLYKYWTFKAAGPIYEVGLKTLAKVGVSGAIFGSLWGGLAFLTVVKADGSWLFMVGLLLGGILLTTIYCYRTVFLGAAGFIVTSGLFLGASFLARPDFVGMATATVLFLAYTVLLPYLAFGQMREFVAQCVAAIKSAEEAKVSDALLLQFEEAGDEWFWATNREGILSRVSDDLRNVLSAADQGFNDHLAQTPLTASDKSEEQKLAAAFAARKDFKNIHVSFEHNGDMRWLSFSGRRSTDAHGDFNGFNGVCADVTREHRTEEKIVEMAILDGLTGLQNRTYFYKSIDGMVRQLERYGTPFSLLFLDLDKFKLVNDTYGHQVGDGLLKQAAHRLKTVLRENDVVGRLGGDEFAIILEQTADPVFIAKLAARIIQEVSAPYYVDGETLFIGVSVGVALAPLHGTQREQLLRNADLALYRAKADGRGVFRYFEAQMDFEQRERRMLEQEMRHALTNDEFEMKFQPMVDTRTGKVTCMEALMRWNHDIRGLLSPDEFISIAEQSNLIVDVGRWSLKSACQTALLWPEDVSVAVNISALHFMRSNIVEDVSNVIKQTGIKPSRLELEITESVLIEDDDETFTKLNGLRELGVTIAMDDFGTGYSSLGYLTKFHFDRLKIDRSFLIDMGKDDVRKAIVYTICTLGENLGIQITVEGVETRDHVEFLKTINCDQAQGYYFSKPLDVDSVPAFLLKQFAETIPDNGSLSAQPKKPVKSRKVA